MAPFMKEIVGLDRSRLGLVLEVLEEHVEGLRLLTVVLDHSARALDDIAGVALSIVLAEASPLAELHLVGNLDKVDRVLGAQRLDQALVGILGAVVGEDAQ